MPSPPLCGDGGGQTSGWPLDSLTPGASCGAAPRLWRETGASSEGQRLCASHVHHRKASRAAVAHAKSDALRGDAPCHEIDLKREDF